MNLHYSLYLNNLFYFNNFLNNLFNLNNFFDNNFLLHNFFDFYFSGEYFRHRRNLDYFVNIDDPINIFYFCDLVLGRVLITRNMDLFFNYYLFGRDLLLAIYIYVNNLLCKVFNRYNFRHSWNFYNLLDFYFNYLLNDHFNYLLYNHFNYLLNLNYLLYYLLYLYYLLNYHFNRSIYFHYLLYF